VNREACKNTKCFTIHTTTVWSTAAAAAYYVAVVRAPPALPQRLVLKVERALFSVRFDDAVVTQQVSGSFWWMLRPRQLEVTVVALFTRPVADAAAWITCIQCPAVPHRVKRESYRVGPKVASWPKILTVNPY
jgi:hypothetical protein